MGRLKELPPELVVGWVLWMLGGVALTIWFRRRAAPPHETKHAAPRRVTPPATHKAAPPPNDERSSCHTQPGASRSPSGRE